MKYIIGLGNPGRKYELTRHNVGFLVVDALQENTIRQSEYFNNSVGYYLPEKDCLVLKPLTYMNLSGKAVVELLRKKGRDKIENLIVVCDDLNLPFGKIRFRPRGSAGGQKGLRSIIQALGTDEFDRLRVGIGDAGFDAVQYVLGNFSPEEKKDLPFILSESKNALLLWMSEGIEQAMNQYNGRFLLEE